MGGGGFETSLPEAYSSVLLGFVAIFGVGDLRLFPARAYSVSNIRVCHKVFGGRGI